MAWWAVLFGVVVGAVVCWLAWTVALLRGMTGR